MLQQLLLKPGERGALLGVEQMARTGAVAIRGAETGNWDSKLWSLLKEFGPVVFEFSVCRWVPDFHGLSHLQELIDITYFYNREANRSS